MTSLNEPKKATAVFLCTLVLLGVGFLSALYAYDPLQVFHKPWLRKPMKFHANMRLQAAGIIKNYYFNSIILGTSLLENSSAKEASQELGGRFVNISLAGSNYYERSLPLGYALKNKKLARVIYSLDYSFINTTVTNPRFETSLFDYLYDDNPLNDMKVYLNDRFLSCLAQLSQTVECVGRRKTLDRPNAWYLSPRHVKRFDGLDSWLAAIDDPQVLRTLQEISRAARRAGKKDAEVFAELPQRISEAEDYVDDYLLKYARQSPGTEFILLFPPHYRVRYAIWAQVKQDYLEIYKAIVRYLALQSAELPNIKIYGWDNMDFVDDITNYKDTSHFHTSINSWMLKAIAQKQGLLTPDNVDAYLDKFTEKAQGFDLKGLGREIDAPLRRHPKAS